MRTLLAAVAILSLAASAPPRAAEPNWHLSATVAESCSCTVSCPCNFGGQPSKMPCHGNRMIAINSGHFEDVDLAGVQFLVTFSMREWSKIYVSDKVSAAQMTAVEKLLPIAFAGFQRGMLSLTKGPVTMDVRDNRVTFSGPESSVEMETLKGFGGKPVKVLNLPSAVFQDYTQYKSISHKHASDKATFSYSGTNGFTSTMDVGGGR
jgi:hypothetical protein